MWQHIILHGVSMNYAKVRWFLVTTFKSFLPSAFKFFVML